MKINDAGLKLLKSFEGCRFKAYQDQGGLWTIGYGHTGKDFGPASVWTQEQVDDTLKVDLERFEAGVNNMTDGYVNENQFSALVCFAYNLGLGNLQHSTLLRKIYKRDYEGAADEFLKWSLVAGQENQGLLRRRKAERELFLKDPTLAYAEPVGEE